ncbi:PE family protein [Mycobacterium bourgelatii]|uniref:PE domain-containing protein n=1 Tax=Mycobacterium bourgelatii TaxID=1273442 RepID=A0A7I9YHM6_MYCBU|nr:PE family protein [Mycobacterium bourgelatii]MCV6976715.1 PE family protein [Mycobacterium bourgelatii]GFG88003.1 hypothetical protein MBOU_00450 [Mycobacterium bourgelatii]
MSHLSVAPDSLMAAAADLENMANSIDAAHRFAAPATLAVSPAAADEVSAGIAQLFSQHAQAYQAVARDAAAFQERFIQNLTASGSAYAAEDLGSSHSLALTDPVEYFTVAGYTFISLIPGYLILSAVTLIPPLWPLFPLVQVLAFARFGALVAEVLTLSPISYPYFPYERY